MHCVKTLSAIVVATLLGLAGVWGCSSPAPEDSGDRAAQGSQQPEDENARALAILNEKCVVCHTAERFQRSAFTQQQWNDVIERMVAMGARLSAEETEVLRHWSPD